MAVLEDLAATILERTREGKLEWQRLSVTGFHTNVGNMGIAIDMTSGATLLGGGGRFVMRFTNDQGTVVETVYESRDNSDTLKEIYELARRQALRVDETLLEMKRALDRL